MQFRTVIPPTAPDPGLSLDHNTPVLLMGSCFSDNIGSLMQAELMDVCVNPFGPLYNPASLHRAMAVLCGVGEVESGSLFSHGGMWHSWLFHSRYSATTAAGAAGAMNASLERARRYLRSAVAVIVTLGTTRVFTLRDTGAVAANCHKMPPALFEERDLGLDECTALLRETAALLGSANPGARLIFTVSPLRYTAWGMHANTLSKATLHLALARAMEGMEGAVYFPAYEIMTDDLRDYRFYADDLKHPSAMAVQYIYDNFKKSFYTPQAQAIAADALRAARHLGHRSQVPGAASADAAAAAARCGLPPVLAARLGEYARASSPL